MKETTSAATPPGDDKVAMLPSETSGKKPKKPPRLKTVAHTLVSWQSLEQATRHTDDLCPATRRKRGGIRDVALSQVATGAWDFKDVYHDSKRGQERTDEELQQAELAKQWHPSLLKRRMRTTSFKQYPFLCCLGLGGACVALAHDLLGDFLGMVRRTVSSHVAGSSWWGGFLVWTAVSLVFGALAALTTRWAPAAAGSGIPEMKSILSGVSMRGTLSLKTLVAKLVGLLFAQASGLSIGKEGPFAHISGALAHQLLGRKMFVSLKIDSLAYQQMLTAACAAGFTANFGAPIGGVLFSIEVTASHYLVGNLWKGFFVATNCLLYIMLLRRLGNSELEFVNLFHARLDDGSTWGKTPEAVVWELCMFIGLGALCGLWGGLFVGCVRKLVTFRLRYLKLYHYRVVLGTVLLTALVTYPIEYTQHGQKTIVRNFFAPEPLSEKVWGDNPIPRLLWWCLHKFCVTLMGIVMPIPCGLFTPVFALGAGLGRLTGELLSLVAPTLYGVQLNMYSMIGAAAMTAGVTRTLSTAVILFELSGQLQHALPVLVAVVTAVIIGNFFNSSVFDEILKLRKLPYLELTRKEKWYASDLMRTNLTTVNTDMSLADVCGLLQVSPWAQYPLTKQWMEPDGQIHRLLLGTVRRSDLQELVDYRARNMTVEWNERHVVDFMVTLELDDIIDDHDDDDEDEHDPAWEVPTTPGLDTSDKPPPALGTSHSPPPPTSSGTDTRIEMVTIEPPLSPQQEEGDEITSPKIDEGNDSYFAPSAGGGGGVKTILLTMVEVYLDYRLCHLLVPGRSLYHLTQIPYR